MNKSFLHATAVMIGTMVGVGIFGIPFAFSKSGFVIGFLFLFFIGLATLILDWMYGEIVLRTSSAHQLVGYARLYLGPVFKRIILFSILLSTYGALLAYIIIAGDFLNNILSPIIPLTHESYSIWFFAVASVLVLTGHRTIAWVELCLLSLFIFVVILIFGFGIPHINFVNYSHINLSFWFLPYGVLLFAFAGMAAIPFQRDILAGQENKLRQSIFAAVFLTGLLYLAFAATVLGVSGNSTSPDAFNGLVEFLGTKIVFLGSLFGILAVSTSFIMLGAVLSDTFSMDYGVSKFKSWLMVIVLPLLLFLGGFRNFIDVIGLAGAIGIGLESAVLIMIFIKAKSKGDRVPEYSLSLQAWFLYALMFVFLGGVVYTLVVR